MSFDDTLSAGRLHEGEVSEDGSQCCHYYTGQPAPTQWVAVGVATIDDDNGGRWRRMVVGNGRTEAGALRSLRRRCQWLSTLDAPVASHPDR